MPPILTFVHITDTHLGPTQDYEFYGYHPARYLRRVVDLINAFPVQPDFVLHTGDLVNDRSADSYEIAQASLGDLRAPLYLVNGNHDNRALLRKFFGTPAHPSGDPDAPLDYAFTVKGERFVVLDGKHADVPDPLGKLCDSQLEWLRSEIASGDSPLTVLLHYLPFAMNSPWLNEHMPLLNGDELHAALLPARDRLRGVFFGHLHRSCQIIRDGIVYTSAASAVLHYAWRPWDAKPQPDHEYAPGYNVVDYFAEYVNVLQYGFPRL
jgi:3',5'-cyclic AMP phosphodiesterase CpdA